jgi:hypothetical protein
MSSMLGRFTSPDPGAYKIADPQTLNRYLYVNNNPLNLIDPSGKEAVWLIDSQAKTVTFMIDIFIWGPQATAQYKTFLKNEIEGAWKGTYTNPATGKTFTVKTEVTVSIWAEDPGYLTARNGILVSNNLNLNGGVWNSLFYNHQIAINYRKRYTGDTGYYVGSFNPTQHAERHEAGHILGLKDQYTCKPVNGDMYAQLIEAIWVS